jgi:hypothetical protein
MGAQAGVVPGKAPVIGCGIGRAAHGIGAVIGTGGGMTAWRQQVSAFQQGMGEPAGTQAQAGVAQPAGQAPGAE